MSQINKIKNLIGGYKREYQGWKLELERNPKQDAGYHNTMGRMSMLGIVIKDLEELLK